MHAHLSASTYTQRLARIVTAQLHARVHSTPPSNKTPFAASTDDSKSSLRAKAKSISPKKEKIEKTEAVTQRVFNIQLRAPFSAAPDPGLAVP